MIICSWTEHANFPKDVGRQKMLEAPNFTLDLVILHFFSLFPLAEKLKRDVMTKVDDTIEMKQMVKSTPCYLYRWWCNHVQTQYTISCGYITTLYILVVAPRYICKSQQLFEYIVIYIYTVDIYNILAQTFNLVLILDFAGDRTLLDFAGESGFHIRFCRRIWF